MIDAVDRLFLRSAVELAEQGLYGVAENPRVGCVIVRDGRVIGRGFHQYTGAPHAEANAIADAGGDIRGATAYVSLEPCCHTGRQQPCTEALIRGGIQRVATAMVDPDPRVAGKGHQALRTAGIAVDTTELPAARALNAGFAMRVVAGRPLVRLKLAASLDGRTAMADGDSKWITSPPARADVQHWRARSSAIVTGIGTVLADDPLLNVRDRRFASGRFESEGRIRQPLIAVADSRGRTPANAKLFSGGGRVLIFTGEHTPAPPAGQAVRQVRQKGEHVDLDALLARLAAEGCNEVLVEAGSTLTGAFLQEGLWDEALVYLAPKILGRTAMPLAGLAVERLSDAWGGTIDSVEQIGPDVRVRMVPAP